MERKDLPGVALAPGMEVEEDLPSKNPAPHSLHQAEYQHMKQLKKGDQRLPRRPASGISGEPKKQGHGGKFTWAGPTHEDYIAEDDYVQALDEHDPNFTDSNAEAHDAEGVVGVVDVPKVAGGQGVARVEVNLQPQ
ncbi:hypothetical protein GOP47_0011007 [Adiantum capillus-veneris]|uniref:Uncharacterized protein n=1 Tax=Adiantum capillus-veneris TaxID=13818 RepID=A0A9D4UW61_ADICA|nr:hypothetical protein GOP47_0011007 [Adiantum capillus-veneris]